MGIAGQYLKPECSKKSPIRVQHTNLQGGTCVPKGRHVISALWVTDKIPIKLQLPGKSCLIY